MIKIFIKTLQDILSPAVIGFAIKIGLGAIFGWVFALYLFWDSFKGFVSALVSYIPLIGGFDFVKSGSAVLMALIFGYILIIVTISLVTSLKAPAILSKLAKKHYQITPQDKSKLTKSVAITLKSTVLFLVLFVLFLPIIAFVPIVGQAVMLLLWAILLKEPTYYDIKTLFSNHPKEVNKSSLWIIAIVASLFNYIPLLNIFATLFGYIMFMHLYLGSKK